VTAVCTGGLGPLRGRGASCTPCQVSKATAGSPVVFIPSEPVVIPSKARDRDRPVYRSSLWETLSRRLWHPERRGRPHERHERHALHRALPGRSLSPRAEMKRGTAARDPNLPKTVPLSFSSLREGSSVAWRDAQYAAHAAHAVHPWVLDASHSPRFSVHPSRGPCPHDDRSTIDRQSRRCEPSRLLFNPIQRAE